MRPKTSGWQKIKTTKDTKTTKVTVLLTYGFFSFLAVSCAGREAVLFVVFVPFVVR